jgi:hypothetical protein
MTRTASSAWRPETTAPQLSAASHRRGRRRGERHRWLLFAPEPLLGLPAAEDTTARDVASRGGAPRRAGRSSSVARV